MCIYIKNSMYNLTPYNTRIIGKSDKNIYTFGIIVFIGLLFVSIIKKRNEQKNTYGISNLGIEIIYIYLFAIVVFIVFGYLIKNHVAE